MAKKHFERDWSTLAPELLNVIAKSLSEISDFVRFRAVCKTWRFSTPTTDLPPEFPWILGTHNSEQHRLFYSVTTRKIYTILDPKYLGKRFLSSSQGYILCDLTDQDPSCHNADKFSLLNPLNNHEILLPAWDLDLYYHASIGAWQGKIGENVVCCKCLERRGHNYKLAFCCLGQDKWCERDLDYDGYFRCFLLKSLVFMVEAGTGVTKVIDLFTGTLAYVIPPVEKYMQSMARKHFLEKFYYHVEVSGDNLLVILRCVPSDCYSDVWFDVYKLDLGGSNSPCWVKVNNIGNQALFIDKHGCFPLEAGDFANVKANCIYCADFFDSEIVMIDIETGDGEFLECPSIKIECWFVPNLQRLQVQ
ncbi:F-box family protein [Rhynchospora pubera]|uniref:F-box family protein n=1 Tax=Rhynchospora pubera TaxID=906938 RepID=A0AAV8GIT6_9POAL|nr:F-box family protein [Rhynchospora pubera]